MPFGPRLDEEAMSGAAAGRDRANKRKQGDGGAVLEVAASGSGAGSSGGVGGGGGAGGAPSGGRPPRGAETQAKAILQLYNQVRDLRVCCLRTVTIGSHTKVVRYMKEAQRQYGEQTRGKRGHGLGTPDYWSFLALVKAGAEEMADTIEGAAFAKILADYTTPGALRHRVNACRTYEAYGEGVAKVEFSLDHELKAQELMIVAFLEGHDASASVKEGRPPKGPYERALEAMLKDLRM